MNADWVCLADFGWAVRFNDKKRCIGTMDYICPEKEKMIPGIIL
jgi:hypothetical protein